MEEPTPADKSWLIGNIAGIPDDYMTGSTTSDGVDITWYEEQTMSTNLGTGMTYTPDRASLQAAAAGLTEYEKTYYITQTNAFGCESEPVLAKLRLINCPWEAPVVTGDEKCEDESLSNLIATEGASVATGSTSGVTEWLWYDESGALLDETAAGTYAHGVDETTAGETKFQVSYKAIELASGDECESPKTLVSVIVNAKPVITINPMSTLCYAGGKKIAEAMVDGVSSTTLTGGTWSIEGETSGINATTGEIDPMFGGMTDASYTIKYVYTNAKSCTDENTASIKIEYPEVPTTADYSGIITDPVTVELTAGNIETGATSVNWYETMVSTPAKSTQNPWSTDDDPAIEVTKSYYVSQTVDGCESERAEQRVSITNCPWKAPTVVSQASCSGETLAAMSATPESGVTPISWKWYDSGNTQITNDAATYTQSNNTTAGVTTYYVSYTASGVASNGFECESPKTAVTSTVYSLPTIEIAPMTVCYGAGSARVDVLTEEPGDNGAGTSNGSGSGVWSTTGEASAISTSGIFNTKANGEQSGTYEVTYTYTDGKGCVSSDKANVEVIYLATPEVTGFYAMTTQTNPVEVNVTSTVEAGATIEWFENSAATTGSLGTGTTWEPPISYSAVTNKTYYARQHKGACFSDPAAAAVVTIVDCPIPTVTISNEEACNYEVVPTMEAESGSWSERDGAKSMFRYYSSEVAGTAEYESADGTYQPTLTGSGEHTYYVSEYNSEPLLNLTNPEGCESARVKVTLKIKETGVPQVVSSKNPAVVCAGQANPTFTASQLVGTVTWYESDPGALGVPGSTVQGSSTTFVPTGTVAGTYSVWAVQYAGGCYGPKVEATYTINPIPAKPTVIGAEVCYEEGNVSVSATGESGAIINWYSDASKGSIIQSASEGFLSSESEVGTYYYYAAQKIDGCEGQAEQVSYRIKPLPSAPVMSPQSRLCEYDVAPTLTATGQNIKWYDAVGAQIGTGATYATTDMEGGSKKYYATQTVEGCEGAKGLVSYTIYAKPSNPGVTGASVCEGETQIPKLTTNMITDRWYADETAITYLQSGNSYTPAAAEIGNSDKTYYVQREMNGCLSDIMPVVLKVIAKPTFIIGGDITKCIYDPVETIQASDFSPAINENLCNGK